MSPCLASLTFFQNSKWNSSKGKLPRFPALDFLITHFSVFSITFRSFCSSSYVEQKKAKEAREGKLIIIYTSPLEICFSRAFWKKYSDICSNIHKLKYSARLAGFDWVVSGTIRYHARRANMQTFFIEA